MEDVERRVPNGPTCEPLRRSHDPCCGSSTRPMKRMLPFFTSRMRNKNGRSISNGLLGRGVRNAARGRRRRDCALLVDLDERLLHDEADVQTRHDANPGEVGRLRIEHVGHAHRREDGVEPDVVAERELRHGDRLTEGRTQRGDGRAQEGRREGGLQRREQALRNQKVHRQRTSLVGELVDRERAIRMTAREAHASGHRRHRLLSAVGQREGLRRRHARVEPRRPRALEVHGVHDDEDRGGVEIPWLKEHGDLGLRLLRHPLVDGRRRAAGVAHEVDLLQRRPVSP